jgi:2-polyprenyl-6-methoxyphenol hydroxylase-like FAD-dependent oxidoreductase
VTTFDVLIAGAGPAGCATALSLHAFAPELRTVLVDGAVAGEVRIGETVPPPIKPVLKHLRVWDAFAAAGHQPSYRTTAAWGGAGLVGNEFLFHGQATGWRLDRAAFDTTMLEAATSCGAAHLEGRVVGLAFEHGVWRAALSDGTTAGARFAVDATGHAATLARCAGLRPRNLDRLVGCWMWTGSRSDGAEGVMIESFAEGWWYTAAVPGRRVVACMTDADRVRPLGLGDADGFARLLAQTSHVARVIETGRAGTPAIAPAASRCFEGATDRPLLCVGDAALRFDPIAGQGILKALRSGIFASYAIADWLRRGDARGIGRYRRMLQAELGAYLDALRGHYAAEQRWPEHPFWQRRRAPLAGLSPAGRREAAGAPSRAG